MLGGAGGYNTAEVIELAQELAHIGVDGILSVTPYYNKPTQEGLYQHYRAIASSDRLPIIVYSVQGRTGVNVEPATLARLAEIENIVGVKEASGNISPDGLGHPTGSAGFLVLSGDDAMTLPLIALGGRGLISVVSNEIPGEMTQLVQRCLDGDFAAARGLAAPVPAADGSEFRRIESDSGEAALGLMGLLEPVFRLPMVPPEAGESGQDRRRAGAAWTACRAERAGCQLTLCEARSRRCSMRNRRATPKNISVSFRSSRTR